MKLNLCVVPKKEGRNGGLVVSAQLLNRLKHQDISEMAITCYDSKVTLSVLGPCPAQEVAFRSAKVCSSKVSDQMSEQLASFDGSSDVFSTVLLHFGHVRCIFLADS